jgi:hypothetical protein
MDAFLALSFIVTAGWKLVFVKVNNVVNFFDNNAKTMNLYYNRIRGSSILLLDVEVSFLQILRCIIADLIDFDCNHPHA